MRPVSACSRCRQAKIKCDGKLPACTACEKAGRESDCSAANNQFARGKERSYVAALELRIEKLERRLAYARNRKASVAMHEQDPPPTAADEERKDSLATIRAAIHRKAARRREDSDIDSLVSDFGYLSVNATARDFEPAAINMTFARLVFVSSVNNPLPDLDDHAHLELPPRQDAYATVEYYMTHVHALYPAFPETSLLPHLNDLYNNTHLPIRMADWWLLWMVLAIGSIAQSRHRQDKFYGRAVAYATRALPYAERALMPGYSSQVQSLFLLAQYAVFDPDHFDSWSLMGFTSRAAIDLGFHHSPSPPHALDKAAQDARRKLFYCVYSLDRAISMIHARPFSFTDDAISLPLPSQSSLQHRTLTTGSITGSSRPDCALLLFWLRRVQSSWYQSLFQSNPSNPLPDSVSFVWAMCCEMRDWFANLPPNLATGVRDMFELELRYSYVYCISPSSRAPDLTPYRRTLIFEHAMAYVEQAYALAHVNGATETFTYHDALRVYFMGSQFVAVLRDAADVLLTPASVSLPLPVLPGKPSPPPLPRASDAGDRLERSLRCLERVKLTLGKHGDRWEIATALMASFDVISADVLDHLKRRRELRARGQSFVSPPLPP